MSEKKNNLGRSCTAEGGVLSAPCGLPADETELQRLLTPEQYRIMRENGTERPFHNAYWDNHEPGIYVDAISGEPLFSSRDKFDSGTGWPSFSAPLEKDNITHRKDTSLGMQRVEVRSRKSNSHLGHLFDDGPAPTGQRYCINSASLIFIPAALLSARGLGQYAPLFGLPDQPPASPGSPSTGKSAGPTPQSQLSLETATFGAGCFWGVESSFRSVLGVKDAAVGFMGGQTENPSYRDVCTGTTGHAEVVQVSFDPAVVSYAELAAHFFRMHDPTTPNRQGPDFGTQYRSVIFFHSPEQERTACLILEAENVARRHGRPAVTQIVPAATFWRADEYHQRYFEKNGRPSCHR